MGMYRDFAEVYDTFMDNVPYELWSERLDQLIRKYGVSRPGRGEWNAPAPRQCVEKIPAGESDAEDALVPEQCEEGSPISKGDAEAILASERDLVVDLGCGTGTLTELMYAKGYDMIGVDASESMLNIAMEKREESGSGILYLLQDMRELDLYSTAGTFLCVCDSLNYILEEDELLEVFRLVKNYLFPGGLFIFDFNTDYKYREIIGDATIAEDREDCSFIWENRYDPEAGLNECDLAVFVREEGDRFRKFTETHLQRGYTPEQIRGWIAQTGLQILEMTDADTGAEVRKESERVLAAVRNVPPRLAAYSKEGCLPE